MKRNRIAEHVNKAEIPVIGERVRRLWRTSTVLWSIADYAVIIFAFGISIAVILIEVFFENNQTAIVLLSALSATMTFAGITINFRQQITKYRQAFCILNIAMLDYYAHRNVPEKITAIIDAIHQGEDIISKAYHVDESSAHNCLCLRCARKNISFTTIGNKVKQQCKQKRN